MSVLNLLTFPDAVVTGRPLVYTSPQSSGWAFVLWIDGFALMSLIAVSLEARSGGRRIAAKNAG